MSQLIDDDPMVNNGGRWWAVPTGTDTAPYSRIFNPITQGEKFDKQGVFIRCWLPELAKVPKRALHRSWAQADKQGIKLGYSRPIVDHKQTRQETLAAWETARKGIVLSPGSES